MSDTKTTETTDALRPPTAAGYTAVPTAALAYLVGVAWRAWAALDHDKEERTAGDLYDAINDVVERSREAV